MLAVSAKPVFTRVYGDAWNKVSIFSRGGDRYNPNKLNHKLKTMDKEEIWIKND